MKKIVLDTNCLLMSLPKISPYRGLWDSFLKGEFVLCISNEIVEELEVCSMIAKILITYKISL